MWGSPGGVAYVGQPGWGSLCGAAYMYVGQPGWNSLRSVWVTQPECDMQPGSDSQGVTARVEQPGWNSQGGTAWVEQPGWNSQGGTAWVEQPGDKVS